MDKTKVIRMFEAFAGMGAQRKAADSIKHLKYVTTGMAEWYIPAIITYETIHNGFSLGKIDHKIGRETMISYLESKTLSMNSKEPVRKGFWKRKKLSELRIIFSAVKSSEKNGNIFDVRTLYKRRFHDVDLLTYSFPCQDLSQQGKQKGMAKGNNTRSGLLWEIEKALENSTKSDLPEYLLMENVMALSYKTNIKEFTDWKNKLESLGYENDWKVLNSGDFGSPQARRRVFMLSKLKSKAQLPIGTREPKPIKSILNNKYDEKDILSALSKYDLREFRRTKSNINKSYLIDYTTFNSEAYVYDKDFTGPTLTASGANSRIKILEGKLIRKINAEEAYRYMGFETGDFQKVDELNYLTQSRMIYTCGNSISVEVLTEIFKKGIK